jgi:ribosomal protein L11 methyltransferase
MKRILSPSEKYSVIEIALCGQDLCPGEKEAARALLARSRVPERALALAEHKGAYCLSCYTRSSKKVEQVRKKYRALLKRPFALKVRILRRRDWFDKWKRDYHIRPLGKKFMIVPAWEKSKSKHGKRMPVILDPGSAFGSGYHETTRLMTRLLESLKGKIGSFLDAGCGTGILSVVASKLGARQIVGFDNDRPSAIVAAKNFSENGCKGGKFFCAQLKSLKIRERFDAVGANLLSRTLLEYRDRIVARVRPGGYILVSGIALQNFPAFKRKFSGPDLICLKILRGRRWAAVLYKRRKAIN